MDEQIQQAFMQYLQQKSGAKTEQEFEQYVKNLGEEGLKKEYQEFIQELQQQQVQAAKFGAKLNYIERLRGVCPEGSQMVYYKMGGRICKKCQKMEQGKNFSKNPIEAFKSKHRMKKFKNGKELPTAPSAKERYRGGTYRDLQYTLNPEYDTGALIIVPKIGRPREKYQSVEGADGSVLMMPSHIAVGYSEGLRDSIASEIPAHRPWVEIAQPVYKSQDPQEFRRLKRRFDEAKSVSKPRR